MKVEQEMAKHQRTKRSVQALWVSALFTFLLTVSTALAGTWDGLPPPPPNLDLSTPRRAARLFIDSTRANDYDLALYSLDLGAIAPEMRASQGRDLAYRFKVVLDRKLWIVWEGISDDPAGRADDGVDIEEIGKIPLGESMIPVAMSRTTGDDGRTVWRVSRTTLSAVPNLYAAYGPGWLAERLPSILTKTRMLEMAPWQWLGLVVLPFAAWLGGVLLSTIVLGIAARVSKRTRSKWDDQLLAITRSPLRLLFMLTILHSLASILNLAAPVEAAIDKIIQILLIATSAWLVTRMMQLAGDLLSAKLEETKGDAMLARGDRTRITLLRRVGNFLVVMIAGALIFTQFEVVRKVGVSLLASAGIAGIVLGFAAQKSISTLLAGLQLSISQPVRIGDTVIVQGEWGWIEEITLTYVVVKIWDLRRLIVPITFFLEKPFENWTKNSPDLLGTVVIHADYSVPLADIRKEVIQTCEEDSDWDGKVAGLIVLESGDHTLTLRATVSASDAGKLWDLRCRVRERLVNFLQNLEGGRYLPKTRISVPERTNPSIIPSINDDSADHHGGTGIPVA